MAKPAKYYNMDQFNDYKRRQGTILPPRNNILAAACHMQGLFDAKKFTWGYMGGLAILCFGYKREMPDLHIAYDVKDFGRLKPKLESDERVRLPVGMNSLVPFKILVWTGPGYRDQGCTAYASIELDLVPSGSFGTPAAGTLVENVVQLSLKFSNGQQQTFKCLNVRFLMATMLACCKARNLPWDPRKDLLYLCKNHGVEIWRIRTQLDMKEVQEHFLGTSFFARLPAEDQKLCYRLLLDTIPPPMMAVTPPAPQVSTPIQPTTRENKEQNVVEARPSRSRYRNSSGGRNGNNSVTVDQQVVNSIRPQSMYHLGDPTRDSYAQDLGTVTVSKPQTVSAKAAARLARRSVPNMMAVNEPVAHPETSTQNLETIPSHQKHHPIPSTAYKSSENELPDATRTDQQPTSPPPENGWSAESTRIETTASSTDQTSQVSRVEQMTKRSDTTKTDSTGMSFQAIQSQKGSLHMASPEEEVAPRSRYYRDQSESQSGSGGEHATPERLEPLAQPEAQHQRNHSAPPPSTNPASDFELDFTIQLTDTLIAELTGKHITPSLEKHNNTQSSDSSSVQATSRPSPDASNLQPASRPANARAVSAPLSAGSLPTSLIAGGTSPHPHRRSPSHAESAQGSTPGFPRRTNAYRYSQIMPLKLEISSDLHNPSYETAASKATASRYKAYRPFAEPDQHGSIALSLPKGSPVHKRSVSDDVTTPRNSNSLAQEYRELLGFDEGYGSH